MFSFQNDLFVDPKGAGWILLMLGKLDVPHSFEREFSIFPCNMNACLRIRVLSLGIIDVWGQVILYWGDCPAYSRVFSGTPGLYPLDAGRTSNLSPE